MWGELRKLRSNEAIRISLYTTGKQICRIAKVAQQRSNSYIIITLQGNKFAELRELRSNAAIRISLLHYGEQILRIAEIAQQCSNSYIINYLYREVLYEHYKA